MIHSPWFEYIAFAIVFGYGFLSGFIFTVLNIITDLCKQQIIVKNVLDFFGVIVFATLFFLNINYYNFGEFRLYLFVSFCLGFLLERKTINKPFAKLIMLVYNKIISLFKSFKLSKLGKIIFK